MNRAEFLDILKKSLEGEIPQAECVDNLRYYGEYFEKDTRSDEEICEELGDPRLIAKSVIEAYLASKGADAEHYTSQARSEYRRMQGDDYPNGTTNSGAMGLLHKVALIAVVLLVILLLAFVLRLTFALLIPILVVVLLWKLIQGIGK